MQSTDFKIAILRNPFDWLVSYYGHRGSSRFGLMNHRGWQGGDFESSQALIVSPEAIV